MLKSTTRDSSSLPFPEQKSVSDENKRINKLSYMVGTFYTVGANIFENLFQYFAIMLGSAGILQGLITSIRQLGTAILSPVWGRLSDMFGRRRFLIFGNLFLGLIALIIPNLRSVEALLLILIFYTLINAMVQPTWTGYLGDVTQTQIRKRGSIIGKIGMVMTLFANIALLVVTFFMDQRDPSRTLLDAMYLPFYLGSLCYFIAALSAFKLDTLQHRQRPKQFFPKLDKSSFNLPPAFKRLLLIEGLFTLCWSSAWPLFPYIVFDVAKTWLDIGLLAFAMAIFIALSNFYGGKLVDRFGKKRVILFSRFFLIFPPTLFAVAAYSQLIEIIYFSNFLVGALIGGSSIAITTLILDSASEENRSTYQALFIMVFGIMAFIGSTGMGLVLQLLTGNIQPSIELVSLLLLIVSGLRLVGWSGYFFLKEPETTNN